MNFMFVATFLFMAAFTSASWVGGDDGQWKGEGLAESQDNGQWNGNYLGGLYGGVYSHGIENDGQWKGEGLAESQDNGAWNNAGVYAYGGAYAYGAAPIGHDGRVVDTPEVAQAKAAHFAAIAAASHGAPLAAWAPVAYAPAAAWSPVAYSAWAPAVYGVPQVPQDTPEVAHAKAQHFAAVAAATNKW